MGYIDELMSYFKYPGPNMCMSHKPKNYKPKIDIDPLGRLEDVKQYQEENKRLRGLLNEFSAGGIKMAQERDQLSFDLQESIKALQGMLDMYEDNNGAGYCECDASVNVTCIACHARNALAKVK